MQASEPGSLAHLQENGVLKRIHPAEPDRECARAGDRLDDRLSELFEPRFADFIRLMGELDYKAELLEHDVKEMIRVLPNALKLCQRATQCCQTWLQRLGRNANDACRIRALVRPPIWGVVAAIEGGLSL